MQKDRKDIIEQKIANNTTIPKEIKIKTFQFDNKTRKKAETNFINIKNITRKISKEYDQFYSKCSNYSIK